MGNLSYKDNLDNKRAFSRNYRILCYQRASSKIQTMNYLKMMNQIKVDFFVSLKPKT